MSSNKVVIVTGGTSGIGEGCVKLFHQQCFHVVFCSNDREQGEALENELMTSGTSGAKARFIYCDVTKNEEIENLVKASVEEFGRIDSLINNVGYHPEDKLIDDFSVKDFRNLFELNVMSYFLFTKLCLPHLRKVQGSIVNISSMVAVLGQAQAVTYASTKGAINAMSKSLAIDEACHGVRVNTVLPSHVDTPLMHQCLKKEAEKRSATTVNSLIDKVKSTTLLNRFSTTEEVAKTVLFLVDGPTFITGIELPVSGGAELNYGVKH